LGGDSFLDGNHPLENSVLHNPIQSSPELTRKDAKMKTNTFVESHPFKDKNLTKVEIKNAEVTLITQGSFEDCKIVDLEIRDENGNVQRYNYWINTISEI